VQVDLADGLPIDASSQKVSFHLPQIRRVSGNRGGDRYIPINSHTNFARDPCAASGKQFLAPRGAWGCLMHTVMWTFKVPAGTSKPQLIETINATALLDQRSARVAIPVRPSPPAFGSPCEMVVVVHAVHPRGLIRRSKPMQQRPQLLLICSLLFHSPAQPSHDRRHARSRSYLGAARFQRRLYQASFRSL
jgi:hypothetical protein